VWTYETSPPILQLWSFWWRQKACASKQALIKYRNDEIQGLGDTKMVYRAMDESTICACLSSEPLLKRQSISGNASPVVRLSLLLRLPLRAARATG
jgi:hypothetical protein